MEPQNLNPNRNHAQPAARPAPQGTWMERRVVAFLRSRIAPPSIQNNNNLEGHAVENQTNQLKTLFSEVSNLIYNTIKDGAPENEYILTELKTEITDCFNHLFTVIFKKLTENDSNLKINGVDILPETQAVRFIENLLILIQKHLKTLDDDSDDKTVKKAFRDLAKELLETAFPGKQADQNLPHLLQSILNGSWFYRIISGGATSELTWDGLIEKFADFGAKLYSSKLNKQVDDVELAKYKGVSQLAKDLTKLVIKSVKELKNIPFKDLSDESSAFLNQIFEKLLKVKNPQSGSENDDLYQDDENIVDQTWSWLGNTLENTISSILCIIFKPSEGQEIDDRYNQFVESMASQALDKIPQWELWENKVTELLQDDPGLSAHQKLVNILGDLKKCEMDQKSGKTNSNNPEEASTLTDILKLDLSHNIHILTRLLKDNEDFIEEAEIFLTGVCYSYFARELFQEELHAQELKGTLNLPEFISADKLFSLIYDNLGTLLKEFHDHHKDITERSEICDQKLAAWNIPGLGNLLKKALADLTHILEEKAEDQEKKLIEDYDFLNEIVCHLLKKPSEDDASESIAGAKKEALSFIEKIIKVIIVEQIDQAKGQGTVEEAIKKISDNLMAKAIAAIDHIDAVAGSEAFNKKIIEETKIIFSTILPEKDFNKLLPSAFQDAGLWDLVCEKLLSPYLQGIYRQRQININYQKLQEPVLEGLVDENLPKLKNKILELRTQVPELDTLLSGVMTQNGLLSGLFDRVAGPIVKSFLAYHVNPKDGKSSQQLTAELFWNLINTAWKAFDDAKQNQPNAKTILQAAVKGIIDRLIPQDLWDSHVSEELRTLLKRENIEELIQKALEKGFADYLQLQTMAERGNENLDDKAKHLQIPAFLKEQVGKILALPKPGENPRIFSQTPWMNEAICTLLQMNNESVNKPLNQLIEALLFGISDHLIAYAMNNESLKSNNVLRNLESKLGIIARLAKPLLDWINQKDWAQLNANITRLEKENFLKITGKVELQEADYTELTFWVIARRSLALILPDETWNQIVPEMVRDFITKDTAAGFLVPILKDIHELRKNLQNSGARVEAMINLNDSAAKDNLKQFLNDKIIASIREVVEDIGSDPSDLDTFPPFVRTLLINLLSTKNGDIKDLRDRLLKQIVYIVAGQLVDKDDPHSCDKIMDLIHTCIQKYQGQKSDVEIATWVFDQVIPNDLWNSTIPAGIRDFIERKDIIEAVVPYVAQIREKIKLIDKKKGEAEDFFNTIDPKHGIHALLDQAFYSLNAMIDEYAEQEEKIAEAQPLLVNDLIKNAFGDAQTSPMIKDSIRSLILIALHEALKEREDDPDQTFQERVLELVGNLTAVFKSGQPSLPQLLQVFIPDQLRKEILPVFLHNSFTYEKIVQWFFEEEGQQIESIKMNMDSYGAVALDDNFERLSDWLKNQLASQKMLKDVIFDEGEINEDIDSFLQITLNEMSKEEHIKSLFDPHFLPYALNEVLTQAKTVELPEGDFNKLAGEKFLSALYPDGTKDLPLPELGKKALATAVGSAIGSVTNRNERLVFINNFLVPKNDPVAKSKAEALEDQIDKINPAANFNQVDFLKDSEIQFKKNVVTFAKSKVDDYIDSKPWPSFFKWLAKIFIKLAVSLVMNISLKHRMWKFISDSNNDDLIKKMIWKFLEVTETYYDEEVQTKTLSRSMQNTFKDHKLIPTNFLRKAMGGALGDYFANNNIVDVLA